MSQVPASACWRHEGLRSGFEVVHFTPHADGLRIDGTTVGLQDGLAFVVSYKLNVDDAWRTRQAQVRTRTSSGSIERLVEADGMGHWLVDAHEAHHLDGCTDVDLESSAVTNALPIHRLGLTQGQSATAPAAYVRLPDAEVQRLEQSYTRLEDQDNGHPYYHYQAPAFEFRANLLYDHASLILKYPGIATRAG